MRRRIPRLFLLAALVLGASFPSCRNPFLRGLSPDTHRFGTLVVNGPKARALLVSDISSAFVTVSGRGMGDIFAETTIADGIAGGVVIAGIPMGKNRVVTVQARRDTGGTPSKIEGVVMRAIVDIGPGENHATVNWASTALGNVFHALLSGGADISTMSDADRDALSAFVASVKDAGHALLVDAPSIAADWASGGMAALQASGAAAYRIAPASLRFQPSPAGDYSAQVGDPRSAAIASVQAGDNFITGIVPGTWPLYLLSGTAVVYRADMAFLPGRKRMRASSFSGTAALLPARGFVLRHQRGGKPFLRLARGGHVLHRGRKRSWAIETATCFRYSSPFTLTESTTVKALASDGILLDSPIAQKSYLKAASGEPGVNHPATGPYSPVDINGAAPGLGWDTAAWSLGARIEGTEATFAVYSKNATRILLEVYEARSGSDAMCDYWMEKGADDVWRARVSGVPANAFYAFRAWGPNWPFDPDWRRGNSAEGFLSDVDASGNRFTPEQGPVRSLRARALHDKSNPAVLGSQNGGMYGTGAELYAGVQRRTFDTGKWAPKAILVVDDTSFGAKPAIERKDAIIYEAHVRGLTKHPSASSLASILSQMEGFEAVSSVPVAYRGTYRGAAYLAPYLKALGINTIELLPVHETDNDHNPDAAPGGNYWGYMTFGYFAPDRRYSYDQSPGGPTREFKEMVRTFHDAGLEVYLDVVYNHSGEGGAWYGATDGYAAADTLFLRGLDNAEYYSLVDGLPGAYWETTGCGNNLRCDNPPVRKLIVDSLSYWLDEMGVDGFRFDLAPVLGRVYNSATGNWEYDIGAATLADIRSLGASRGAEMIAEAWDTGGGATR
jgi:hypothetical protein